MSGHEPEAEIALARNRQTASDRDPARAEVSERRVQPLSAEFAGLIAHGLKRCYVLNGCATR